jgi:glycyl-tRNA synthetase beta subunit
MGLRLIPVKSRSDGRFGFLGSGRIAVDSMYNNIMTKFRWGNFDKEQLFVDRSYAPSVYSMRGAMIRLTTKLIEQGDNERAMNMADKCLEAYPNMNFPFDQQTIPLIRTYAQTGNFERGKKHILTLATEFADRMNFYNSLSKADAIASFQSERQGIESGIAQLNQIIATSTDEELKKEVNAILGNNTPVQNIPN